LKGWGLGRGCALPSWGSGGLPPEKNEFCAKNYAILSKVWYFFPILEQKVGGGDYSPVLKVGDLSPCPPCSDAYDVEQREVRDKTDKT